MQVADGRIIVEISSVERFLYKRRFSDFEWSSFRDSATIFSVECAKKIARELRLEICARGENKKIEVRDL